jgi:hypothetical protein
MQTPKKIVPSLLVIKNAWQASWEDSLKIWSRYTRLREPCWCLDDQTAREEGLSEGFAMIRLVDQSIVINLGEIQTQGLADFPVEIMSHEIGHHILCPADLNDQARLIAYTRRALPGRENQAGLVANLYTDLLINDRLKRESDLRMDQVYQILLENTPDNADLWNFYVRIYEILWSLPRGTLVRGKVTAKMEGDAYLGSRLVRVFRRQWLLGAGRFAALCLPYLETPVMVMGRGMGAWRDTRNAVEGGMPQGLTEIDAAEVEGAIHPAFDPRISGDDSVLPPKPIQSPPEGEGMAGLGQHRQPFEYGQILKALGLPLDDHRIAVQYYRERARAHLIAFPSREMPESREPLMEGLEPWTFGEPVEKADWQESVIYSPHVIPGMTTFQRTWGHMAGSESEKAPLDLDLYVDCSGSMPNPQVNISYTTLAGAIIALSALRAGARVQATLWSGANQFDTTGDFIRDEDRILSILTGYLGGSTAFPLHILRETYEQRAAKPRPTHILVISDLGVDTLFNEDERGNSGESIVTRALETAGGGCTLALNIRSEWRQTYPSLVRAANLGMHIHAVNDWADLVKFAREFSRRNYGSD